MHANTNIILSTTIVHTLMLILFVFFFFVLMFRHIMSSCTEHAMSDFSRAIEGQMLQVNALMMGNAILMGVMVGIGVYGHRYRHHPLTRFLFLGSTLLFLPIVSYIVSTTSNQRIVSVESRGGIIVTGQCARFHRSWVLVWSGFVQIVGINTATIVSADAREGRSIAPPALLLVQAIWTTYLGANILKDSYPMSLEYVFSSIILISIYLPFPIIFAKIFLKYKAWYNARKSFAFGRNPRLIVGYMEQLQDRRQHVELASEHIPPPLVVTGEDTESVEKQPHGYSFKWTSNTSDTTRINNNGLATMDKVWQMSDTLPS